MSDSLQNSGESLYTENYDENYYHENYVFLTTNNMEPWEQNSLKNEGKKNDIAVSSFSFTTKNLEQNLLKSEGKINDNIAVSSIRMEQNLLKNEVKINDCVAVSCIRDSLSEIGSAFVIEHQHPSRGMEKNNEFRK